MLSLPLQRKRERSAKSSTKQALIRQFLDQRDAVTKAVSILPIFNSDEDDSEPEPKRQNTGGSNITITKVTSNQLLTDDKEMCAKCGSIMLKRR